MIELAKKHERQHPLGCRYVRADVAEFEPAEPVDLVVAAYLLNYARTLGQLLRFCRVCYKALKPGGRFVGLNNDVRNVADASRVVEEVRLGADLGSSARRRRRYPLHDVQR